MSHANALPILIIQMGVPPDEIVASFGEQGRWMQDALAGTGVPLMIVRPASGEPLPAPDRVAGAVLTGSWNMVTDREDWSEHTAAWIREAMATDLPLLGICYGHQLMAHALGGVVDYHPKGRELGCFELETLADSSSDPVLGHLPARFNALLSHDQTVLVPPQGARVLARSAHDPHQILRYSEHALSVQFHPEFSVGLLQGCINRRAEALAKQGVDVEAMMAGLQETGEARGVLLRFAVAAFARAGQGVGDSVERAGADGGVGACGRQADGIDLSSVSLGVRAI